MIDYLKGCAQALNIAEADTRGLYNKEFLSDHINDEKDQNKLNGEHPEKPWHGKEDVEENIPGNSSLLWFNLW